MPLILGGRGPERWEVRHIGVIGPGIVGMPMAAMLAHAGVRIGSDTPARVTVVQRDSPTSGWKVGAINAGRSPIGGVEPDLSRLVAESVAAGRLSASHDPGVLADADVVLVAVQTDRRGDGPEYGPLFDALGGLAAALRRRPAGQLPLVVIESTLAPSSMGTVVRDLFAEHGLVEGRDVLLANSPNRVMPGRLVERVGAAPKLVAGLHPAAPALVARLYRHIVTRGELHPTNSMTAEVVKALENAYRDVRIAFASTVARQCDADDIDFYAVREAVNARLAQADAASLEPTAVPTGGLLVPTVGVGGHCLPKDGILLWWRALEAGLDSTGSRILEARRINDASPAHLLAMAERRFGPVTGRRVAILGVAYRFDSEDTRNSPTLRLARLLADRGAEVSLHDPYVSPGDQNLTAAGFRDRFSRELEPALAGADLVVAATAHGVYRAGLEAIAGLAYAATGLVDGCHLVPHGLHQVGSLPVIGIGRGRRAPSEALVSSVLASFRGLEQEVSDEVDGLVEFLNRRYAGDEFNRVAMDEVRRLAETCPTGCRIVAPSRVGEAVLGG